MKGLIVLGLIVGTIWNSDLSNVSFGDFILGRFNGQGVPAAKRSANARPTKEMKRPENVHVQVTVNVERAADFQQVASTPDMPRVKDSEVENSPFKNKILLTADAIQKQHGTVANYGNDYLFEVGGQFFVGRIEKHTNRVPTGAPGVSLFKYN